MNYIHLLKQLKKELNWDEIPMIKIGVEMYSTLDGEYAYTSEEFEGLCNIAHQFYEQFDAPCINFAQLCFIIASSYYNTGEITSSDFEKLSDDSRDFIENNM